MYAGDHIVLSSALAVVIASRFNFKLVPTMVGMILLNTIDIDHIFYHYLDDDTKNSLILHPAHIYAGIAVFVISLSGIVRRSFAYYALTIIAGYSLHLATDALASFVQYQMQYLLIYTLITVIIFSSTVYYYVLSGPKLKLIAYMLLSMLTCYLIQASIFFGLHIHMNTSILPIVVGVGLCLLATFFCYVLFKRSEFTLRK
ncbi:MAG: hypothetical protein COB50_00200 [Thiotrichales bacterium]|nr:MAG: hypothetical protein COB50_00200 [Thiotrichales bacterium]